MNRIEIRRPDDWHLHLRDGDMLAAVVPATARVFGRAIVMPNLKPPVRSLEDARAYRDRILAALPEGSSFEPLMTLYLTETTTPEDIREAAESDFVHAVKYYPAGATTNSDSGVRDLERVYPVLEAMERHGVPLLMHGEVTDGDIDVFDREAVFIERHLEKLRPRFPELKMVLEHATTADAIDYVKSAPGPIAATITVHHLMYNRNALFEGGLRPHHYCLPLIKRERHRQALVAAATGGNERFFLGTDSAPHPRHAKESDCGCAGIYSAPAAIELYAEIFEAAGALDKLESFASLHGPDFYGLPHHEDRIALEKREWTLDAELAAGGETIVPLRAGASIGWQVKD
ncbi:dihydroorotase [Wenzhouxiangella sediminis]|uniref:Dihydroorotase n=1 Tax=Wenzhouxiangella sediminis TaxID=1792836 RepID=A0A3E1K6Y3_9GAMM|nr:dihydroorotase [Wenzhouxiangella sediminis]RFF29774.1 dihydroorotase [Wenzhouxiangella sediminis]